MDDFINEGLSWMNDEDSYLEENFPIGDPVAIERKLGRSWEACRKRAYKLGLRRTFWQEKGRVSRKRIRALAYMQDIEIAERLSCSVAHVRDVLRGRIAKQMVD